MNENEVRVVEARKEGQKKGFFNGLFTGVVAALLVVTTIFCVCKLVSIYNSKVADDAFRNEEEKNADDGSVVNDDVTDKMSDIENVIERYFYLEEVDKQAMEDGIYEGMLTSLDDPYSTYYSKEELESIMQDTQGVYYGIGAYVSLDTITGYAQISGIIAGAPAEEVDLREEDLIYAVDGVETFGMSLEEVVALIKGEEGTKVHLTLVREGETDYIEIDVERRRVEAPTVTYEVYDDKTAYIQITEFSDITEDQFTEALAVCKASGMTGLILDLRSNPGGNLDTVVKIARQILPEGLIVYTEDRDGNRDDYTCNGENQLDVPLVVLIDGNSASAAEILAGAIKDYGIGTLVGTTSYGKGIVQRIITLGDGSAVKLTVSAYYTPNGNNIHEIGIEPDIVCEFDSDSYYEEDYDNQLEKAKEVLQKKIEEQ